jgi:cytochrome P450
MSIQVRSAPGPRGAPLLGSLGSWQGDTAEFLLSLQRDYGEVVRMRLGPMTVHQVTDPQAVRRILQENNANYTRGPLYAQFKLVMGKGLLTSDGPYWRSHRRAVQPLFLKNAVAAIGPNVVEATTEMLDTWEAKARVDEQVDLISDMLRLTLVTLSRSLAAYDISPSVDELKPIVDSVMEVMFKRGTLAEMLPSWLPTARNRRIDEIHRVFGRIVEEARAGHAATGKGPLIDLMESATDPVTGARWTDKEIRDELVTIYVAGYETTAVALTWTLIELANHPWAQEELDAEVEQVLGGDLPEPSTVDQLSWTGMVIDESLRLHPPVWIYPRAATEADVLGEYDVPAGSPILLSPLVSHRNPRVWADPEAFDPRRFTPESVRERPKMAYFPFGAGSRMCLGNAMALMEMRMIITMISQRFRLSLVPGNALEYGDPFISLRPRHDVLVKVEPRARRAVDGRV